MYYVKKNSKNYVNNLLLKFHELLPMQFLLLIMPNLIAIRLSIACWPFIHQNHQNMNGAEFILSYFLITKLVKLGYTTTTTHHGNTIRIEITAFPTSFKIFLWFTLFNMLSNSLLNCEIILLKKCWMLVFVFKQQTTPCIIIICCCHAFLLLY